jgi:hypothetical protein
MKEWGGKRTTDQGEEAQCFFETATFLWEVGGEGSVYQELDNKVMRVRNCSVMNEKG